MGEYLQNQYLERDYAMELAKKNGLLESNKKLTWEELKEKAKEMGYVEYDFCGGELTKELRYSTSFYKNGDIEINYDYVIAKNRTPEQMLMIMRGLE